jgi:AcrR family transcriptional regulator
MDVAEARLAEFGYLGVSLEEVAKEVGVSKPALYYHFPGGKEQLFVEIAHRALTLMRESLERAMSGLGSGAEKLHAAARWLMEEHERGRPMGELRDVVKFVAEEHRAGLAQGFYTSLFGPIRRAIAEAVESGEFHENDPDFLTWSFLGLALGMMDVGDGPGEVSGSERPGPPAIPGAVETSGRMVDLFLEGALK